MKSWLTHDHQTGVWKLEVILYGEKTVKVLQATNAVDAMEEAEAEIRSIRQKHATPGIV